jgi:CheY-like chemotaxis protein
MDAETVRRAFEPFFTTKPEGTGLGLAHAHAVARAHDGAATVSSALGQGTELRFELPETVFVGERVESGGEVPRPHRAGNPRALVVDDEPMVLRATARLLHEQGWSTTTVTTGDAALTALEAHEFDLVLTDRSMPGMSGEELCRRVHALRPRLAIVMMTGLIDEAEERALLDDGVRAIVTKPFRSSELADALASAAAVQAPTSAAS